MSADTIKAVSLLYKAGYEQEKASALADRLLTPENGEIVLDYKTFCDTPKGFGTVLAQILPASTATKLKIDFHNPVYGYSYTPVHLLRTNAARGFGDHKKLDDLFACLNKTKIATLEMNELPLGEAACAALSKTLTETKTLKNVEIRRCDIAESLRDGTFAPSLTESSVERIGLPECGLNGEDAEALLKNTAKTAALKSLDLSGNNVWNKATGNFLPMLPDAMRDLNAARSDLGDWHVAAQVAAGLLKAPQLTDLDLSASGMDEASCRDIFAVLPKMNVLRLDVSGNALDDAAAKRLVAAVSNEDCSVYQTRYSEAPAVARKTLLGPDENTIDPATAEALRAAEKVNEDKYQIVLDQERAAEAFAVMTDAEKAADPFTAAKAGRIGESLDLKPLKPADFLLTDDKGKTLLTHAAEAGCLAQIFEPKRWTNPKEMQSLWDNVSDKHKKQMDGQDGRPSFIKAKSVVTATMLKNRMAGMHR